MCSSISIEVQMIADGSPDHKELCVPAGILKSRRSKFLFTRAVLIRHLTIHLPPSSGVQIHVFPSLRCAEFEQFLVASPIHFVMAHDGALPATGNVNEELAADRRAKIILRGNIGRLNTLGLSVALINRIEFRDSKVSRVLSVAE
jgi:hypothetical protein